MFLRTLSVLAFLAPTFDADPITSAHERRMEAVGLANVDPPPGSNGGGGGAGGGFTDEQLDLLDKRMGNLFNNMLSGRIGKILEKAFTDYGATLDKKLEPLLAKVAGGDEPPPNGKSGKNAKGGDDSVEFQTLRRELETERKAREASEARTRASEVRRRDMEKKRTLDEYLAKGGVSDPFMRELAISHFTNRNVVAHANAEDFDDPTLVWNGPDGMATSFESGFKSWLKTDEAARFLPPRNVRGSGGRAGGSSLGGAQDQKAVENSIFAMALDDLA
jgi:hypothetical protein